MIAQILNRQFVLDQLEEVKSELARPPDHRRGGLDPLPFDNSVEELAGAANELEKAHVRELARSSGQAGFDDDPQSRRGQEPAPIDDTVFLSHDPIISLLQSALSEYFEQQASGKLESNPATEDGRRSDGMVAVAEQTLADCPIQPRDQDGRRVFNKYSETDPRWVASLFAMSTRLFRRPHAFNAKPAEKVRIAPKARLILVGDWGTGLPRAVEVAKQMRKVIEEGRTAGREQHVIHLGDVYYSGLEREYRRNFLAYWPVRDGETSDTLRSWCLNGNHDMYSGGHAYFDFLLADPRFARQQKSSFFSLHNDFWNILGLDTAHEEAGLRDPQAAWLAETLAGPARRSMLLSHHQFFSAYESPSAPLEGKIGDYLKQHPIDVWFWGHEHRCVFYKDHQGVRNARLIGHGGVPVYMTHPKEAAYKPPSFYEYREFIPGLVEKWAYFGFAVVDLDDGCARVRYIDEFGTTHKTEVLP